MQYCVWLSLSLSHSLSLISSLSFFLIPSSQASLNFSFLSLLQQGLLYQTLQILALQFTSTEPSWWKCIILASVLLDIHGFIYKSLCSTFFAAFYGLYYCRACILVGISNKNQDIPGKCSVMPAASP